MEAIPVVVEVVSFIFLLLVYYKLCHDREASTAGKVIELLALYGMSIWTILANLKFTVWAFGIAVIGLTKILTTKKASVGRQNKGIIS